MKKFSVTIIDTLENFMASPKIIPDGMIAKVMRTNKFRIGDGMHTFSELEDFNVTSEIDIPEQINFQVNGVDSATEVTTVNFETFKTTLDDNGVLTVRNPVWYDGSSYDLPFTAASRRLDGGFLG